MQEQRELEKLDDFLQKLKKVVRIVLYGPAISQSGCRKADLYQLPYDISCTNLHHVINWSVMGDLQTLNCC